MKTLFAALACLVLLIGRPTPGAAQDRWQVELNSGAYLWDVQLVRLQGPSLVVRQADTTVTVPVREITQLRLVVASGLRPMARAGTRDEVYQLTLQNLDERLALIREIFQQHPPSEH